MRLKPYYFITIMLSIVAITGCEENNKLPPEQTRVFPLLSLQEIISNSQSPLDISNKFLIINFWASWCTPCRREMPDLQALSESIDSKKIILIGISIDTDKNLMQEFLLQHNILFNNFLDSEQKLAAEKLDIQSYPETFIVSPEGRVIKRISGEQAWNSQSMQSFLTSLYDPQKNNKNKSNITITGLNENKI